MRSSNLEVDGGDIVVVFDVIAGLGLCSEGYVEDLCQILVVWSNYITTRLLVGVPPPYGYGDNRVA